MHYKQYFGVGLCMEKIHLHLCNSLTHNYLNQKCRKTAHDQSATCLYRKERTSQLIPGRGVIILNALRKQSGREFGTDKDTLQYLKQITNKDLLYGTGNFLEQPKREKNLKKNRYMYVHN